jgi:tetratricopeptide (TPR) repeat protein
MAEFLQRVQRGNSFSVGAMTLFRARRYGDAIRAAQPALELDPAFVNVLWWQGMSYAGKQDYRQSFTCLTRAVQMIDNPLFRALLFYGLAGQRSKALGVLEEHTEISKQRYVSPVDFAIIYAGLGDVDAAFRRLEQAYQARSPRIHELILM